MKLHRDLGVTQKTAWMMAHKIRTGWLEANTGRKLSGVLEADETYMGGLEKNKHWDEKLRASCGTIDARSSPATTARTRATPSLPAMSATMPSITSR